jgi:hypothetical protein
MQKNQGRSTRRIQKIHAIPLVCLTIIGILLMLTVIRGELNPREYEKATDSPEGGSLVTRTTAMLATGFGRQKLQGATKDTLSVDDPRPVAEAITVLEARFRWIITYEDPRYIYAGDISDVTEKVRKDLYKYRPGEVPRVLIPKGGKFNFEYDVIRDTNGRSDPGVILQRLLDAYAASGSSARFRMESTDKSIHIIPTGAKDISGKLAPQKSVLDAVITLPVKDRTGLQALEDLCVAVSRATQMRVVVGTIPIGLFIEHKDQHGVAGRKAREALAQLLERMGNGTNLSWQLLYDPGMKMYALNIHGVR